MNKRNYILEAMSEGKTPVDPDVMCGAVQYYSDLISEAIFPMSESDTMYAIVALETMVRTLRERNNMASRSADVIKLFLGSDVKEFNGTTQDMEEIHRAAFKNAPK